MPNHALILCLFHIHGEVDWVKSKLKTLRNSYTKAKKPQKSGSARKNPSRRTSWIFEKMQFLDPFIATRTTTSNLDPVSIYLALYITQQHTPYSC